TGGMKPVTVPCRLGKIAAADLEATLARYPAGNRAGRPVVLSLTEATEAGTLYSVNEIAALAGIAHAAGLVAHMDGARFANAVAGLGVRPADLTWKAGIDLMSFGGTKNGCWAAEAIVVFEPGRWPDLDILKSRAGHTFSKARFVAAQFEAYLGNDHWLQSARHANGMARRLADELTQGGRGDVSPLAGGRGRGGPRRRAGAAGIVLGNIRGGNRPVRGAALAGSYYS